MLEQLFFLEILSYTYSYDYFPLFNIDLYGFFCFIIPSFKIFVHILALLTLFFLCCLIVFEVIILTRSNMDFYELYCQEVLENEALRKEIKRLKQINQSLTNQLNYLRKNQEKIIEAKVNEAVDKVTRQFEDKVVSLEKQVSNLKSILNNDSSNSSIPTSQTPISKNKRIPNSRKKSDRAKGGHKGHPKHSMEMFDEKEITDYIDHRIEECPQCHSPMNDIMQG